MDSRLVALAVAAVGVVLSSAPAALGDVRTQDFASNTDGIWEGVGNRRPICFERAQDFGYRPESAQAGGDRGEVGGRISQASQPAFYGRRLPPSRQNRFIAASGRLAVTEAHGQTGALLGFFNSSSRGWRTPNTLVIRLQSPPQTRNRREIDAFLEYGTRRGASVGTESLTLKPMRLRIGHRYRWSLSYHPSASGGRGGLRAAVTEVGSSATQRRSVALYANRAERINHRAEGFEVDRLGILTLMNTDGSVGNTMRMFVDDLRSSGSIDTFTGDASGNQWQGVGNDDERYADCLTRSNFGRDQEPNPNFGWSESNRAGGGPGELGGPVFRVGPGRRSHYADRLGAGLSLDTRLHAEGKLSLQHAITDSDVYFGWFNHSSRSGPRRRCPDCPGTPDHFVGFHLGGKSRYPFVWRPVYRPAYRTGQARHFAGGVADERSTVRPMPDGAVHRWSLDYRPARAPGGGGILTLTVDGKSQSTRVTAAARRRGASFDRFGLRTNDDGDGRAMSLYLDDLVYEAGR